MKLHNLERTDKKWAKFENPIQKWAYFGTKKTYGIEKRPKPQKQRDDQRRQRGNPNNLLRLRVACICLPDVFSIKTYGFCFRVFEIVFIPF